MGHAGVVEETQRTRIGIGKNGFRAELIRNFLKALSNLLERLVRTARVGQFVRQVHFQGHALDGIPQHERILQLRAHQLRTVFEISRIVHIRGGDHVRVVIVDRDRLRGLTR